MACSFIIWKKIYVHEIPGYWRSAFLADPVVPQEMHQLNFEISVLSHLKLTDDPLSLHPDVDGIYTKKDHASGCFFHQVTTETGWSKEDVIFYCCEHKAGLSAAACKDAATEVHLFSADVFGSDFKDI